MPWAHSWQHGPLSLLSVSALAPDREGRVEITDHDIEEALIAKLS